MGREKGAEFESGSFKVKVVDKYSSNHCLIDIDYKSDEGFYNTFSGMLLTYIEVNCTQAYVTLFPLLEDSA